MVRILHTADLHLDYGFTPGLLPYNRIKDRRRDLLETFDRIIGIAKDERAELLLISGDLFEHRYIQTSTVNYVNQKLKGLSETYVFILPGNHDPYHLIHYYKSYPWGKNVHIFTDDYGKKSLRELNVVVHGFGFGYQEEKRALLEDLHCRPSEEIQILMVHGSDMSSAPRKVSNYLPFNQEDLRNSGFDYIALGHYHQHKLFDDDYGNIIAAYPGSPEPLGFDETGPHGIIIGDIQKGSNDIHFQPISNREYFTLELDISDCQSMEDIKERIIHHLSPLNSKHNLFSIKLKGSYQWDLGESVELLEDECKNIAFHICLKDDSNPGYDIDSFIQENSLLSSYILEIQRRMDLEKDENRREILKKALNIGIQAFKGGGYKV